MSGEVCKGDLVICAVWSHADDLPASRWVTFQQLSDREEEAILATVQERCGAKAGRPIEPVESKMASHMSSDELLQCLADVV